ncbi:MAG: 30S ribosomal protein S8 [Candidatus Dojkabacteria bacterium]|nr:MAG: 30S ribosomal protein S8 [Candidatus Dojkabacteria bacterium]
MSDIVADTLARIKNAVMRRHESVNVTNSKISASIVEILKQENFVEGYEIDGNDIVVSLKYAAGEPMVENFVKVSKPGQRIYVGYKDILPVMNGRGIAIISTSNGLMTGAQAKSKKLGGEYICKIW